MYGVEEVEEDNDPHSSARGTCMLYTLYYV